MYCKFCSHLYSFDMKHDQTIFLNCKNCGNEEKLPNYMYISIEVIIYINIKIHLINKQIENFICK